MNTNVVLGTGVLAYFAGAGFGSTPAKLKHFEM
jgi:hypothetical protein